MKIRHHGDNNRGSLKRRQRLLDCGAGDYAVGPQKLIGNQLLEELVVIEDEDLALFPYGMVTVP